MAASLLLPRSGGSPSPPLKWQRSLSSDGLDTKDAQDTGSNTGGQAETDFGQTDFGQTDFGQTDFGQTDFGQSDFGQTDFGQKNLTDFGQP